METYNLEQLAQSDEELRKTNPLILLGIDPWVLRSMGSAEVLRKFIEDQRRLLTRYFHPDKFQQDKDEKVMHNAYLNALNSGVDQLLKDDFYLQQSLKELTRGDVVYRYQEDLLAEKGISGRLKKEARELGEKLKISEGAINKFRNGWCNLKTVESELMESSIGFPLVKSFGCTMSLGEYVAEDIDLCQGVDKLFGSGKKGVELELAGREITKGFMKRNYYPEKEKKNGQRERRQFPIFDVEVRGNKFQIIYKFNLKSSQTEDVQILGSLTYSSIKEYLGFYGKSLVKTGDDSKKVIGTGFGMTREFSFDSLRKFSFDAMIDHKPDERLCGVLPFLSNFIFPETFLLGRKEKGNTKIKLNHYFLIIPTEVSNVRYLY